MRVAIASGKGGTGKTTVAVNLAQAAETPVQLLDCDVEAPNCHIFLTPRQEHGEPVHVTVPMVDANRCDACGECAQFCAFRALACVAKRVLVFPELCHGCGGCMRVCPKGAITEGARAIGTIATGKAGAVTLVQGCLNIGEAMAPPLIRAVGERANGNAPVIIDAPPGTSCPMIAAVRECDFVVLVTEPTPFGLHDLRLAVETIRTLGLPFGVVINRSDANDPFIDDYCAQGGITVLMRIPDDRRIAEAYARGALAVDAVPGLRDDFRRLWGVLCDAAFGAALAPRHGG